MCSSDLKAEGNREGERALKRGRERDVSVSKACHKYLKTSMRPEAGRVDFNLQEDQQKKPGQGETGPTRQ